MSTKSEAVAQQIQELATNKARLLELLGDGRWHDQWELVKAGGLRYSARIMELRGDGHAVETHHVRGRQWSYRLVPKASLFGED
jgi:hypothetical protein